MNETEQTARWQVDAARGGGWTVSKHTEDEYIEYLLALADRQEAENLRDRLNALEARAALAEKALWKIAEMAGSNTVPKDRSMWSPAGFGAIYEVAVAALEATQPRPDEREQFGGSDHI